MVLVAAGYLAVGAMGKSTPVANAAAKTANYSGTVYVAGDGGHYAIADITIDPASANPIVLSKSLDRLVVSAQAIHDVRIDNKDRTKGYFSTYQLDDKIAGGKSFHRGTIDFKTNKVTSDNAVELDPRAPWAGAVFCASGQTDKEYLPVSMTQEAYIDVVNKSDMSLKHRVFLDKQGFKDNYLFLHGTNSPDMKTFVVAVNGSDKWDATQPFHYLNGKVDMLLLDLPELAKGNVKVLARNSVNGEKYHTITFRQYFTPDGKKILQAAGDRLYVFNAKTLKLEATQMMTDAENHDAMPTPDGKYAVLTLRATVRDPANAEAKIQDGQLALYDIAAKKIVGKATSVCNACHKTQLGKEVNAPLCGMDGNLK
jgi:hypothetical protein